MRCENRAKFLQHEPWLLQLYNTIPKTCGNHRVKRLHLIKWQSNIRVLSLQVMADAAFTICSLVQLDTQNRSKWKLGLIGFSRCLTCRTIINYAACLYISKTLTDITHRCVLQDAIKQKYEAAMITQ